MAGESPGKSEQQKSSGETGPDERDARAGAPREAEADGADVAKANTEARSGSGAGADGEAETDAEAAITEGGAPTAATTPVTPGRPADAASETASEAPETSEVSEETSEISEAGETAAASEASAAREVPGAGGAPEAQEAKKAAERAADAVPDAPGAGTASDASGADSGARTAAAPASGPADDTDASEAGDSRAEAPGTTPRPDGTAPKAPSGAGADTEPSAGAEPGTDAKSPQGAEPGTDGEPGRASSGGADAPAPEADAAPKPASTPGPTSEPAAEPEPASGSDSGPGARTGSDSDSGANSHSDSGSGSVDEPRAGGVPAQASGQDGPGKAGDAPAGSGGSPSGGAGAAGGKASGGKSPAGAPSSGGGKSSGGGASAPAGDRAPGWAKGGVDQPTTAIRTVGPAGKKAVDQPTTALKLPSEPPLNRASAGGGALAGSTFVPLKRDDAPSSSSSSSTASASSSTTTPPATSPWPSLPTPGQPGRPARGTGGPGGGGGPITPVVDPERTSQQPVPPKDPLDLLAELTNTPDTPVRVVARRFKIWTPLVLLLLIVFVVVQAVRPLPEPTLALTAPATYSFAGSRPQLPWPSEGQGYLAAPGLGTMGLFGKEESVPVGSVAKLMTAYLVLKDHPLKTGQNGPSILVDKKAEQEGGLDSEGESTLNTVHAGDKLTLKDALSALMVQSANNIARLLARWDAGSEAAFVKKMNATAKDLGMDHTTYTDPSGLKSSTVSSAQDQVLLGQKIVGIPALTAITVLPSWTDPSGVSHRNYNALVPYNGAIGLKTGTTTAAGGNLVFAAHKVVDGKDQLIVGAIFAQHKSPIIDTVNAVSKTAMIAAENELKRATVVHKGQVVGRVDDGLGGTTPVVATADAKAVGWGGLTERLQLTSDDPLAHSAKAGTRVGTLTVGNGLSSTTVPVALQRAVVEPGFGAKLGHF
ncbi:D-alanyl-D-alanine carboxypeptidase [Streptomyces fuscigenes]|uniref:D-alanyl-D-alanine carboxypeptidase n=1 Tax=Streptomyces fuscigenes TaxID=1528880 RepID=UPI001F426D85|nr:serine hydrolase [Streptomyces fuscigenes]MCF3962906.1 D-alanyl-D-alanine carboxypeptidase [Streptomyces fuscigenes]